ncbi:MAG: alpha/beta hydrolase family esterase [Arachnia sp.]
MSPVTRRRGLLAAVFISSSIGVLGLVPAAHADEAPADASCTRSLPAGTSTLEIQFESESYDVLVTVPDVADTQELALVLDLHGSNSNGPNQLVLTELGSQALSDQFIIVEPTGDIPFAHTLPDGNWAWNVPGVPLTSGDFPPAGSRDDVAFLRAVVEQVDASGCVDNDRVFATGFSGGGRMASALACEASDIFAAIAPVAGLRSGRPDPADLVMPEAANCTPENPVAVISFHGNIDFVNPWEGNLDLRWGYTVPTAAEGWAAINQCEAGPTVEQVSNEVRSHTWTNCSEGADVVLYEVIEGGHTWPGSPVDMSFLGYTTQEISASALMLQFFLDHPRPAGVPEPEPTPDTSPSQTQTASPEPSQTPKVGLPSTGK